MSETANAGFPAIGQADHRQPIRAGGERRGALVRREFRRDEDHALKTQRLARRLGQNEVAQVDRVEAAAEDAQLFHAAVLSS